MNFLVEIVIIMKYILLFTIAWMVLFMVVPIAITAIFFCLKEFVNYIKGENING